MPLKTYRALMKRHRTGILDAVLIAFLVLTAGLFAFELDLSGGIPGDKRIDFQESIGLAILLVEQKLSIALRISHRVYIMGHGRIVFEGTPDQLKANEAVRKEWLEV